MKYETFLIAVILQLCSFQGTLSMNPRKNWQVQVSQLEEETAIEASSKERGGVICPLPESILPCTCFSDINNIIVLECYDIQSEEQLLSVFSANFPEKAFTKLILISYNVKRLSNIFNGLTFKYLDLRMHGLEEVTRDAFDTSIGTLEHLKFCHANMTVANFPFEIFEQFTLLNDLFICYVPFAGPLPHVSSKSLSSITFYETEINDIAPGTFGPLPNLKTAGIEFSMMTALKAGTFPITEKPLSAITMGSQITHIEPGTYFFATDEASQARNFITMTVTRNLLTRIEANTFPLRNAAVTIKLGQNQINTIQPNSFVLPNATDNLYVHLDLSNNNMTTIDQAVFEGIFPFFTDFNMRDNPLACECDIAWIVTNPAYLNKMMSATCVSGGYVKNLNPAYFELNC